MDAQVIEALRAANLPTGEDNLPLVFVEADDSGQVLPASPQVRVGIDEDKHTVVTLRPLGELLTGQGKAPDLSGEPPREWQFFLMSLEATLFNYCAINKRAESDQEFERVLSQLRRRPDGRDPNKLYGYVRAALQLYLSLHDVSREQYEAVVGRLIRSARTFSQGHLSRNYFQLLVQTFGPKN